MPSPLAIVHAEQLSQIPEIWSNMLAPTEEKPRPIRILIWAAAAAIVILILGPAFLRVFRPPPATYLDFVQEWLSARCYWMGEPIYLHQRVAMQRVTGQDLPQLDERPWNAHPPVAVLVALPFGLFADYQLAHLLWNLATFGLFLVSIALILHELEVALWWWSIFPAIVLIVADNPVISQLWHGQLNFLLVFLLTLAWIANRRGHEVAAGLSVGLAIAIKLFPGLLLIYFVASRTWRSAAAAILSALVANAVAIGLFGWIAVDTYVREVLPSLEVFRGSWGNASITGYTTRLLRAICGERVAPIAAGMCQLAIVFGVARTAYRATTQEQRDRAFAIAIAAMPLVSPIAWAYYFVLLILPLLFLWQRIRGNWQRGAFAAALVILLLPEGLYPGMYSYLIPTSPDVAGLANHLPTPADPGLCAIGLAFPTLALLAVFGLLVLAPLTPPQPSLVELPETAS